MGVESRSFPALWRTLSPRGLWGTAWRRMVRFPIDLRYPSAVPSVLDNVTTILAVYGAIVSTIIAAIQVASHLKDRVTIRLRLHEHVPPEALQSCPAGMNHPGMKVTVITAANVGRRPVTIEGFAASLLFPQPLTDWLINSGDAIPPLPCQVTEGQFVSAFVDEATEDLRAVGDWYAWDGAGRQFRLHVAPWYKRWYSAYRRWSSLL